METFIKANGLQGSAMDKASISSTLENDTRGNGKRICGMAEVLYGAKTRLDT